MTTTQDIEAAIVQRLKPLETTRFIVAPLPENQADATKAFVDARIWVAYDGSRFEPNGSGMNLTTIATDASVQEETVHFTISIHARKLRGEFGIYDTIAKVKRLLLGFKPDGCDKLRMINIQFQKLDENTFCYDMLCGTVILNVEQAEDENDTYIQRITLDEPIYNP